MKLTPTTWEKELRSGEYGHRSKSNIIEVNNLDDIKVLASSHGFVGAVIEWRELGDVEGTIEFFNDICDDIC